MSRSPYVSRVNQIDAVQLDEEIYKVLRNQTKEICKYRSLEKVDKWQPEIDAILKYLIWYFSLRDGDSTFGQKLLNLHYENVTRSKSILYAILTIAPSYVRDKSIGGRRNRPFSGVCDRIGDAAKLVELINLLIFLNRGTQPRVIEFLLGIASRTRTTHKPRNIGYSYMTRELLWHGLMELFTTALPMVNFHYMKHAIRKLFVRRKKDNVQRTFPTLNASSKCAYCTDSPILPVHAGCKHVFCYYCLKAHFTAVNAFQCSECDTQLCVENMRTCET